MARYIVHLTGARPSSGSRGAAGGKIELPTVELSASDDADALRVILDAFYGSAMFSDGFELVGVEIHVRT